MKKSVIALLLASSSIFAFSQSSNKTTGKYDFIAGEKVIVFDDFTAENVGDFPVQWNTNASGEVVTASGFEGRWFKMTGPGSVILDSKLSLPENYTIEFDIFLTDQVESMDFKFGFNLYSSPNPSDMEYSYGDAGIQFIFGSFGGLGLEYSAFGPNDFSLSSSKEGSLAENQKFHMAIWVQKTRIRYYIDEEKVFDLPKAILSGLTYNTIGFQLFENCNPVISNFRLATGLPDMRSKLITDGKLVSYGIYFDVNKDVVKSESYGTLKEIANVLKENPDVRVKIVGHTDADGADAANLDLSKRRGASVKNELVKTFGIDASRLESDGLGETQPIAPNNSAVNKALNRRVEFIKI